MSKRAEEAALKAYPKEDCKMWHSAFGTFEFDKMRRQERHIKKAMNRQRKTLR